MENFLPVPLVQMGHVEKLAEMAQNQPVAQQQVLQETTAHELKNQQSQVPKADEAEEALLKSLRERTDNKEQRRGRRRMRQRIAAAPEKPKEAPLETSPHGDNPWAGIIVDMKI